MTKAANICTGFQAQSHAAGMFSFCNNSTQWHAISACLFIFLVSVSLITIGLLGLLSLVVILLSLVLMQMEKRVRARIEG